MGEILAAILVLVIVIASVWPRKSAIDKTNKNKILEEPSTAKSIDERARTCSPVSNIEKKEDKKIPEETGPRYLNECDPDYVPNYLSTPFVADASVCLLDEYINENDGTFNVLFFDDGRKASRVLYEYCKREAISYEILPNIFPDDNTINIHACFLECPEHIGFINHCLARGTPIYKQSTHLFAIRGYSIYEFPLNSLLECISTPNYKKISEEILQNAIKIKKLLYEKYNEPYNELSLPNAFMDYCINTLHFKMLTIFEKGHKYVNYTQRTMPKQIYFPTQKEYFEWKKNRDFSEQDRIKRLYNEIYSDLVEAGKQSPKWQSEKRVFDIARSLYPDAIYQYRVHWLGAQSLDVYIPSINVGIEYQGQQHYQPVEIFGGEEHFKQQQELDRKKRRLCKQNNIKLLEIRYDEVVNIEVLKGKIENLLQ